MNSLRHLPAPMVTGTTFQLFHVDRFVDKLANSTILIPGHTYAEKKAYSNYFVVIYQVTAATTDQTSSP